MRREAGRPATKSDLKGLRQRIGAVDSKMDALVQRLDGNDKRIAVQVVNTQAELCDLKERIFTKDDAGRMFSLLDEIRGHLKHDNRAVMIHGEKLTDHERRLTRLENPRSS